MSYFQRLSFLSYHLGREDPQFHGQINAIAGFICLQSLKIKSPLTSQGDRDV
ncbi:hypothetical protein O53_962 [Microcystis aeruginosa TAIHU98]|uniref:Uncharacterized protein n=1 Tax=Microcystis aeruginosa TAIHU98 TaxID=1134457 RepID=L7ECE3_MICAE|nr:hypothetical protein O53_962 [Microcystis aeruginosa TAIHU98]